jgi:hypothetical protein
MSAPAGTPAQRKVRFAILDGNLVETVLALDNTIVHQEPLRIVKSRHWVQIGCTRMDWATYDELTKRVGADE